MISNTLSRGIKNVISEIENIIENVLKGNDAVRVVPEKIAVDFEEVAINVNRLIDSFIEQMNEKCRLEKSMQYNQRIEAIGTLAGGISHDFNNILTYMYTYADLVLDDLEKDSDSSKYMNEVICAIDRASKLVGQIMTFSRNVKNELAPIQISLIINEALKLISATLPKNIIVKKEIKTSDLFAMADSTQINQVIMNLCTNSFHALLKKGGILKVVLDKVHLKDNNKLHINGGDYALLEVSDTGDGFKNDIVKAINEIFK